MARGDHIKARRLGIVYAHHGIDLGDGTVVHFGEPSLDPKKQRIRRTTWQEFAKGGPVLVVEHDDALEPEEVCARAQDMIGQMGYNLALNNCEHFATWCATGRKESVQVWRAAAGMAVAGLVVVGSLVVAVGMRRFRA